MKIALLCLLTGALGSALGYSVVRSLGNWEEPVSAPQTTTAASTDHQPQTGDGLPDLLSLSEEALVSALERLSGSEIRRSIRSLVDDTMVRPHHQEVLKTALEILANKNPEHFLKWISDANVPVGLAIPGIESAATHLAGEDPAESIEILQGITSFLLQRVAMKAYGAVLAERDPELAMKQLTDSGWWVDGIRIAASSIAGKSPATAAHFFANMHEASYATAQIGLQTTMAEWARRDPEAAFEWLTSESNAFPKRFGMVYFLRSLAQSPGTAGLALRFHAELPNASQKLALGPNLAAQMDHLESFENGVLAEAKALANPFERAPMIAEMTRNLSPEVVSQIVDSLPGQKYRKRAIAGAIQASADSKSAIEISAALATASDRIDARNEALSHFANRDDMAEAARVAFAAEYPRERSNLLSSLAEKVVPDPDAKEAAPDVAWISSLDSNQRIEVEAAVQKYAEENGLAPPQFQAKERR